MEGHGRRLLPAVVVALALAFLAPPAAADSDDEPPIFFPPTVTVKTHPNQVSVDASAEGQYPGTQGLTATSGGSHCWLQNTTNIGEILWPDLSAYPTVKTFPFFVWCDGQLRGLVFLDWHPSEGSSILDADPHTVAMQIRDQMPIPAVQIAANPDRGMAGVKTWFWVTGYDGRPLERTTPAFGSKVQVRAEPAKYRWDFGDGTIIETTDPGHPYPQASDVIHTYERSSAGLENGYTVQVTFVFDVSYRVNGGPWQPLPGISRTATDDYPVQETQAVIQP